MCLDKGTLALFWGGKPQTHLGPTSSLPFLPHKPVPIDACQGRVYIPYNFVCGSLYFSEEEEWSQEEGNAQVEVNKGFLGMHNLSKILVSNLYWRSIDYNSS